MWILCKRWRSKVLDRDVKTMTTCIKSLLRLLYVFIKSLKSLNVLSFSLLQLPYIGVEYHNILLDSFKYMIISQFPRFCNPQIPSKHPHSYDKLSIMCACASHLSSQIPSHQQIHTHTTANPASPVFSELPRSKHTVFFAIFARRDNTANDSIQ